MVGTAVLEVEVVGVLPNVEGQQRRQSFLHGIGGIRLLRDDEFSVVVSR